MTSLIGAISLFKETGPPLYLPKTKYGNGIQIIRIDDFQDGYVKPLDQLQKVQANASERKTYGLNQRNLVINRVNSPTHLGKCMVVRGNYVSCLFESNMMNSEISEYINVEYIDLYIQSKFGRERLIKNAKWAVNQASINQQDVKSTEVTLPSLKEQNEIAQLAFEKMGVIERLQQDIELQLAKAEKNKQSILATAFSGDLVSGD